VDRTDGHVSIAEFYDLMQVVEIRGGQPKFRSVPVGEVPADTLQKVCSEADFKLESVKTLFEPVEDSEGKLLALKSSDISRDQLLEQLAELCGREGQELASIPAVDFLLEWLSEGRTPYELCCTSRCAFTQRTSDGGQVMPEHEAERLALAQLYVLTLGQVVPAVYFNDLLGLENDFESYRISGKPRDLGRHKSYFPESGLDRPKDPFLKVYLSRMGRILEARSNDGAFYPGSRDFEFLALSSTVFLNHPYARGLHSFIVGNISSKSQSITLELGKLAGVGNEALARFQNEGLEDALTGEIYRPNEDGGLKLTLPAYGALWLKVPSRQPSLQ
jgi:hypothetical protein